jgi:hypothetical protein
MQEKDNKVIDPAVWDEGYIRERFAENPRKGANGLGLAFLMCFVEIAVFAGIWYLFAYVF